MDRLELTGDPIPVLEGVRVHPGTGLAQFAVAANGSLVYLPTRVAPSGSALVWMDRQGNEEPVAAERRPYASVQLSPDGRRLMTEALDPENTDVAIYALARDTPTRFTFDPAPDRHPIWTPAGDRVVFMSPRHGDGPPNLYWKAADGTGQVERLTTNPYGQIPLSFSRSGGTLAFSQIHTGSTGYVGLLSTVLGNGLLCCLKLGTDLLAGKSPDLFSENKL